MRERGEIRGKELVTRERRWHERERWEKIKNLKYNKWYGRVRGGECRSI